MLRLSVRSSLPSVSSRAMWLRVTAAPPFGASVVKSPPAKILPSACTAIEWTVMRSRSGRTNQPSRWWHRAGRCGCASVRRWCVKTPPAKILPSACTAIEWTALFAFGLNESAKPVVASSRAMRLRVCPPMLFAP